MQQFELNSVDLNPGYLFFYSTASIKNFVPFDIVSAGLIYDLIHAHIDLSIQF